MYASKVIFAGTTLIDITDSTVTPETLKEGVVAYDKAGNRIVGTQKPAKVMPDVHVEIAPIGIWNASRSGNTTFTFGNSINRKALGTTYDVSKAEYIEFDIYIPSGKDVTQLSGQTQFELSSQGKEDLSESTLNGNFLAEYDINYGGWTHICLDISRLIGSCDLSKLNFIGWYWVGSSYTISGCKVANLVFTSYKIIDV